MRNKGMLSKLLCAGNKLQGKEQMLHVSENTYKTHVK